MIPRDHLRVQWAGVRSTGVVAVLEPVMKGMCLLPLLLAWLIACDNAPPPGPTLLWDLTEGRDVSRVGWPVDHPLPEWNLGRSHFRLSLAKDMGFEGQVERAHLRREDDNITEIILATGPMDRDAAYQYALQLAERNRLWTSDRLDAWYATPRFSGMAMIVALTRRDPCVEIEIGHSYLDDRPFIVYFNVLWPSEDFLRDLLDGKDPEVRRRLTE
jgi:hypothetical protein